jgi:hypothetical protein
MFLNQRWVQIPDLSPSDCLGAECSSQPHGPEHKLWRQKPLHPNASQATSAYLASLESTGETVVKSEEETRQDVKGKHHALHWYGLKIP